MPRFDPAASLRVWAIEVTVGGRLLRVPPLPAADWLPPVMAMDPFAVLELVEGFDLGELLVDAELTVDEIREAAIEIIEAATGRSSIAAFAIAGAAGERWDIIGADVARAGVRFEDISIGAALDAIYGSLCRAFTDEKALAEFNRILDTPTEGDVVRQPRRPRGAKPLPANAEQYVQSRPKTQLLPRPDRPGGQSGQPSGQPPTHSGSGLAATSGESSPGGDAGNLPAG